MSHHNEDSDQEIYADNLSDISCESDFDSDDSDLVDDEDIIPLPTTFTRRTISSSSDEEEVDGWSINDNPPVLEDFLGIPGITLNNPPKTQMDVLKLFIDDDFFKFLVIESNRYYYQNIDRLKSQTKGIKWKDITIPEMKKFVGLIIFMGLVRKDRRNEYWTTDPVLETPFFGKTMSRDRFNQIWRAWHFNNNEDITDPSDRLEKVRPIINHFVEKFKNIYKPKQQVSLDEGIIPWRGRLFFRVYNAGKIIKYGILVRILSESDTGYICNFEIYAAQGLRLIETIQTVVSPYTDVWHHLYMDNYYNSVDNTVALLQKKIRVCGTIRKNRGLPECLKKTDLQRGDTIFRRKNDILLQVWKSKKEVSLISSIHSAEMKESHNVDRMTRQKIIKPNALIDYNKYMKGVDRADQYLSYYNILRKTTKWTKRVAMYMINCALFNSFVVYNSITTKKIKYKRFLYDIAFEWTSDSIHEEVISEDPGPSTSSWKRAPSRDPPGRLSMDMRKHVIAKIESKGKKKFVQRQCRVCSARKVRSETCFICKFCEVPLHRGKCFERYHTLKQY